MRIWVRKEFFNDKVVDTTLGIKVYRNRLFHMRNFPRSLENYCVNCMELPNLFDILKSLLRD